MTTRTGSIVTDDRSVAEVLIDEIVATEKQAKEIRASSSRLLNDERVRTVLSPSMLTRAASNFNAHANECEMAAKRMRELARQLGIEAPKLKENESA